MKLAELFETSSNQQMTNPEVRELIQYWVEKGWLKEGFNNGDSIHGFQVASDGSAERKLDKLEIVNQMLTPEGTFPFKLSRAKYVAVRANNLSSFKNFPEQIEHRISGNLLCLDMLAPSFPHLTSLEGCPKYCRGHARLSRAKNLSYANVHKHILAADVISIYDDYVGPMLGFLKITNLKEIRYVYSEDGRLATAAEIINDHLAKDRNVLAAQEELIDNDLKDYAEL
jgi:hypothetical protein